MADVGRTYIRVHDGMPDHPKVGALSDRAFRLLIETWCWCSRHLTDGRVPRGTWNRQATPKARRELVEAGLVEDLGSEGVVMHDYLVHQRSRAEVEEVAVERREAARKASVKANHKRWHTGPDGVPSPDCELCRIGLRPDVNRTSDRTSGSESGTHPSASHRSRSRSREVVKLGGEALDPNAEDQKRSSQNPIYDPDEPRCARHADIPAGQRVPACGECADIRRIAEKLVAEADTERDQRRQAWRADVKACEACDDEGWIELPNGSLRRHHPHPDDVRTAS
jgi:hypothetical protein